MSDVFLHAPWRAPSSASLALGAFACVVGGATVEAAEDVDRGSHVAEREGHLLPGGVDGLVGALVGFVTQRYPDRSWLNRKVGAAMFVALITASQVSGQDAQPRPGNDSLGHLAPLIGRWQGTSEGQPGKGQVEREYRRALGDRFIRVTNRTVYPPQERNLKGEIHEDEGWFSYDRARKRVVFRQFHIEGFVNQYLESETPLLFVSEAIENIPAGWRARETYTLRGRDELEEVFELAEPGKEFEVYSRTRLTRVP